MNFEFENQQIVLSVLMYLQIFNEYYCIEVEIFSKKRHIALCEKIRSNRLYLLE